MNIVDQIQPSYLVLCGIAGLFLIIFSYLNIDFLNEETRTFGAVICLVVVGIGSVRMKYESLYKIWAIFGVASALWLAGWIWYTQLVINPQSPAFVSANPMTASIAGITITLIIGTSILTITLGIRLIERQIDI